MPASPIDTRNHLVGPCAYADGDDNLTVDVGAVVRRLVLFERYTLRTIRMREIGALVRAFGEGGLRALLDDGCLRIHCDMLTMGSMSRELPPGTFRFTSLRSSDQSHYVSSSLRAIHAIAGLSDKQVRDLKRAIADTLTGPADGRPADRQLDHDLDTAAPVLRDGIALAVRTELQREVDPDAVRVEVERLDDLTVATRSNLAELLDLDAETAHHVVQRGLLAVGGLNTRIEIMEHLNAISGCMPDELPVFDGKLRSLWRETDPNAQEERFLRVLELAGLPEPDPAASPAVDVDKLLEARELAEAKALRDWLRTADRLEDDEIRESFDKTRETVARAVHGKPGQAIRFAATTAVGFIPGGNLVAAGLGALDTFLVDRLVAEPGPYSFLSETWPSLLEGS